MKLALGMAFVFLLSLVAMKGPLKPYVPNCPVTFGFCIERAPS